mgnify:CR=1 FL=1
MKPGKIYKYRRDHHTNEGTELESRFIAIMDSWWLYDLKDGKLFIAYCFWIEARLKEVI